MYDMISPVWQVMGVFKSARVIFIFRLPFYHSKDFQLVTDYNSQVTIIYLSKRRKLYISQEDNLLTIHTDVETPEVLQRNVSVPAPVHVDETIQHADGLFAARTWKPASFCLFLILQAHHRCFSRD